jgi:ATP-dependent HslUV protease ATP-binding subunit HslU
MSLTVEENKPAIKKSEPPKILDARDQGRNMTPKEIVAHLDRYIVSQNDAKRSVAIALRNRWRRQQLPPEMRDEVAPKNIVMIGPTGVGKTEIARRLSKLVCAPFIKVEASKFTEVGYVGRDVESIIRDLTHLAVNMVREEQTVLVEKKAKMIVEERLLDLLLPPTPVRSREVEDSQDKDMAISHEKNTREKFRKWLMNGKFEDKMVEVEVQQQVMPMIEIFSNVGMEEVDLKDMLPQNLFPPKARNIR